MKKLSIVLFLAVVAASSSYAQDLKPFRFGIGTGYALAFGTGASGGVILGFEPSYRVKDNLSIGLRAEFALVVKGVVTGNSGTVATLGSWTLNGQYYIGDKTEGFRPFVGAGLGIYNGAAVTVTTTTGQGTFTATAPSTSDIGFYPRVGFDISHFTLNLDYNIVGNNGSYLGVRAAVQIGGGKK
jgi:outer membrane protein W